MINLKKNTVKDRRELLVKLQSHVQVLYLKKGKNGKNLTEKSWAGSKVATRSSNVSHPASRFPSPVKSWPVSACGPQDQDHRSPHPQKAGALINTSLPLLSLQKCLSVAKILVRNLYNLFPSCLIYSFPVVLSGCLLRAGSNSTQTSAWLSEALNHFLGLNPWNTILQYPLHTLIVHGQECIIMSKWKMIH